MLCCAPLLAVVQDPLNRLLAEANAAYRSLRTADAVESLSRVTGVLLGRADVRV